MIDRKHLFGEIRSWQRFTGETLLVLVSMALVTLLILLLHLSTRTSDSLLLYLLVILILACTRGLYAALLASFIAFFTFDFFFVPPVYGLGAAKFEDVFSLLVFLVTAIITGQLASALRILAMRARRREYEASTLYEFMRATNRKSDLEQQMRVFTHSLSAVFASAGLLDCMLLLPDEAGILRSPGNPEHGPDLLPFLSDEAVAAEWVMLYARTADLYHAQPQLGTNGAGEPGKVTMIRLLPLQTENKVCGVLRLLIAVDAHHPLSDNIPGAGQHASTAQGTFFSTFLEQAVTVLEQARLRESSIHLEVLQQTEAQRSALFSSVSHDLRTPLATIRAAASNFLQNAHKASNEAHETLASTIEYEVKRLDGWIENVLDISRLEAGSLRLEKVWYPLDELVQDAVSRVQFALGESEIRVTCPRDLPPVELDPVQIEQVMINLLENALHYAPPGTPVDVHIELQEPYVLISVADRGPGIPRAEREHIFEKFYRISDNQATQTYPQGLGLGLAICRGSINAHGGHIRVEERDGGGARFCFTLPFRRIKEDDIDE